ncbi:DUF2189 domain-containing protein [Thalassotalea sp. PLHSN55]|uniref:DUF2189 domain-containing protein n=1 Tax=Thalassotalea sp. PLHSN55 TaxID=3435888 RepID=UPI003F82C053
MSGSVSVRSWLKFGWQMFTATKAMSMLFSLAFCVFAVVLYALFVKLDAELILYPFIAGFFLVAPLLIIGYQRVAAKIYHGQPVTFSDLYKNKTHHSNRGIWFLVFILCFCYFIWLTDALVIYGLYFGIEPLAFDSKLITDETLRESLFLYIFYSGLMGLVTAIIGFLLGVFAIPLIIHQNVDFVAAIHISIKTVMANKWLMTKWASTLVILTSLTLVVAVPLLVIVLPVLGYASYAVYHDLIVKVQVRENQAQENQAQKSQEN